jgi:hypothetical protein
MQHAKAASIRSTAVLSQDQTVEAFGTRLWNWCRRSPVALSLITYTAIIIAATIQTWDVYMWWGHYMLFPVVHVYEISKVWSAQGFGQVPWCPDYCFGYGYPYFTLYGPLGFFIGALFHFILGLDYGPATKLSFYASLYLSGLFMYAFVYLIGSRERWPRLAWWALAAATVYALTRYHLTDVFSRSVLAESWAWATLPGVYLGMELARRRPLPGVLLVSLMYAGLLISHNITALWASIFIPIYPLLTAKDLKWPTIVAAGGTLGVVMSAFFWYPALRLSKLTLHSGDVAAMWGTPQSLHTHAIYWQQHFIETLGYGASVPGPNDQLGINMGLAVLIGVLLAAVATFQKGFTSRQRYRLGIFLLLTFVVLFIMSPQMPWQKVPSILLYVQFPWRLLIFTAFFGAAAMAMASPVIDRWIHPAILAGIAAMFAIPTLPMISMPQVIKKLSPEQLARWNYRWERKGVYGGSALQEFLPKWVHGQYLDPQFLEKHPIPENRLTVTSGDLTCDGYTHLGTSYEYSYNALTDSEARIALFYWPGWELRVDGIRRQDNVKPDADGLISINLPAGRHQAELRYDLSQEGKIARVFSSAAIIAWISILLVWVFSQWQAYSQRQRHNENAVITNS